jgi:P-type Ca2+ transporter type 2C
LSLILLEIANAFNFRSFRKGVLNRPLFTNKYLVYASIISLLATILIIYTPLSKIFSTVSIGWANWLIAIISALLIILLFDILKIINKKKKFFKLEGF